MDLPESMSKAVTLFSKFPGVGEKSALRFVLNLANWSKLDIEHFAGAVAGLKELKKCTSCGLFADESLCEICLTAESRDTDMLCVVESIVDCLAVERSRHYKGLYHVLGGALNPLMGIGPDELNLKGLPMRVRESSIKNVILALNPSVEGDATCAYIREFLPEQVKIDRIGFGIPIGGSLEYVDAMTISKALENRQEIQ